MAVFIIICTCLNKNPLFQQYFLRIYLVNLLIGLQALGFLSKSVDLADEIAFNLYVVDRLNIRFHSCLRDQISLFSLGFILCCYVVLDLNWVLPGVLNVEFAS